MNDAIWGAAIAIAIAWPIRQYLLKRTFPDGSPVMTNGHKTVLNIIITVAAIAQGGALYAVETDGTAGLFISMVAVIFQSVALAIMSAIVNDYFNENRRHHISKADDASETDAEKAKAEK